MVSRAGSRSQFPFCELYWYIPTRLVSTVLETLIEKVTGSRNWKPDGITSYIALTGVMFGGCDGMRDGAVFVATTRPKISQGSGRANCGINPCASLSSDSHFPPIAWLATHPTTTWVL